MLQRRAARVLAASSPEGHGVVRSNEIGHTYDRDPHYSFWHIPPDGSSVPAEMVLGDYGRIRPYCLAWTGGEYAMVFANSNVDTGLGETRIDFVTPGGLVERSVEVVGLPPFVEIRACVWAATQLAVLSSVSGNLTLSLVASDGSLTTGATLVPIELAFPDDRDNHRAVAIWTGAEIGVAWNDDRSGNSEVYFARFGADGARRSDDVRVTRTAFESTLPSLVWTGDSYAVVWNDSDGVDLSTYWARFAACP